MHARHADRAARPPMLIDDAGHVIVAIDADMKPLKGRRIQWARGGKTGLGDVSGPERARICATLAVQAWRRAMMRVRAPPPPLARVNAREERPHDGARAGHSPLVQPIRAFWLPAAYLRMVESHKQGKRQMTMRTSPW